MLAAHAHSPRTCWWQPSWQPAAAAPAARRSHAGLPAQQRRLLQPLQGPALLLPAPQQLPAGLLVPWLMQKLQRPAAVLPWQSPQGAWTATQAVNAPLFAQLPQHRWTLDKLCQPVLAGQAGAGCLLILQSSLQALLSCLCSLLLLFELRAAVSSLQLRLQLPVGCFQGHRLRAGTSGLVLCRCLWHTGVVSIGACMCLDLEVQASPTLSRRCAAVHVHWLCARSAASERSRARLAAQSAGSAASP